MVYEQLAQQLLKRIESKVIIAEDRKRIILYLLEKRLQEGFSMSDISIVIKYKCTKQTNKESPLSVVGALSDKMFYRLLDECMVAELEKDAPRKLIPVTFGGNYEQYLEALDRGEI